MGWVDDFDFWVVQEIVTWLSLVFSFFTNEIIFLIKWVEAEIELARLKILLKWINIELNCKVSWFQPINFEWIGRVHSIWAHFDIIACIFINGRSIASILQDFMCNPCTTMMTPNWWRVTCLYYTYHLNLRNTSLN